MTAAEVQDAATVRAVRHLGSTYRKRPLRFIRHERIGDWRLKVYGISAHGDLPRPELVAKTVALAREALPQPACGDDRSGIGFVVAHDATTAGIALIYWWQSANELHQRVFVGPRDDLDALARLEFPAAGCVWEMGVIDFERRAWIEDVLANPAGPDIDRYLKRRLDTEV